MSSSVNTNETHTVSLNLKANTARMTDQQVNYWDKAVCSSYSAGITDVHCQTQLFDAMPVYLPKRWFGVCHT